MLLWSSHAVLSMPQVRPSQHRCYYGLRQNMLVLTCRIPLLMDWLLLSSYHSPFFCPTLSVQHQRSYHRQMPNIQLFLLLCRLPFLHPKQRFHLPELVLHLLMPWNSSLVLLLLFLMPWKSTLVLLLHILMPWKSTLVLLLHILMPWKSPLLLLLHVLMPWNGTFLRVLHFLMPWNSTLVLLLQLLWLPHLFLSRRHSSSSNLHLYPCCWRRNSVLHLYLL